MFNSVQVLSHNIIIVYNNNIIHTFIIIIIILITLSVYPLRLLWSPISRVAPPKTRITKRLVGLDSVFDVYICTHRAWLYIILYKRYKIMWRCSCSSYILLLKQYVKFGAHCCSRFLLFHPHGQPKNLNTTHRSLPKTSDSSPLGSFN